MKKAARHFIRFLPVRGILATLLLCSVVAVVLPLSSASSKSACQLECCAGRAAHSAGSCLTGACHARIRIKRHAHVQSQFSAASEKLCGLSSRPATIAKQMAAANLSARRTTHNKSARSELLATSLGRPCPPDCGGLASAFASTKQTHKVLVRRADSLLPAVNHASIFVQSVKSRAGLCRRSIPRGPPHSFT